jgi:hypothetical protein
LTVYLREKELKKSLVFLIGLESAWSEENPTGGLVDQESPRWLQKRRLHKLVNISPGDFMSK